ncbi:hypothetical protein BHE74_00004698 [Ensete ventricosum]|nr:hypothetical protein GW17_00028052 [Ensete ventricosum]RWW86525.1 hypothetical protein BHE74_00004698 [Ensete ventricosum]RZR98745.1 hypothetical protein BHM03_00028181 [Ensete ventricosum]
MSGCPTNQISTSHKYLPSILASASSDPLHLFPFTFSTAVRSVGDRALISRAKRSLQPSLAGGLKSITDREVCCYMISCKNSTNIDSVIDWLVKHSKSKN